MRVSQSGSPDLLERFRYAVCEIGKVYGPYDRSSTGTHRKPVYAYHATGKAAHEVMRRLMPYLGDTTSSPKVAKYMSILEEVYPA